MPRIIQDRKASPRRSWWIVAAFLAVQIYVIWFAPSGPFVDESLYTVAGMPISRWCPA